MCRAMDPNDYVLNAWPIWMSNRNAINLVAQAGNRIVGCAYGEILAFPDGWSQAARVHPEMRRTGIGLKLMAALEKELMSLGANAIFGNIGEFNESSLAFFTKQNWEVVWTIKRRLAGHRNGTRQQRLSVARQKVVELVQTKPVLASIEKMAYFKRAYFRMNDSYLERAISSQAVKVSPDADAYALLDLDSMNSGKRIWVVAIAGSYKGMQRILEELMNDVVILGAELIVDSTDDSELQAIMDNLQFKPSEKNGSYFVVKKDLTRQAGSQGKASRGFHRSR
jgi:ribosomal protein S18 acetylase RimI-like enzyme